MNCLTSSNPCLNKFLPELSDLRRHLHAHPELSGNEHQTAAMVAGELRRYGWRVQEAIGRTGVVAELGPVNGPLVGLRVDMDALPIEEKTGLPYSSLYKGIMHASGDVVAILHSDDRFCYNHVVSDMVQKMADAKAEFCFSDMIIVDGSSNKVLLCEMYSGAGIGVGVTGT